MLRETGGWACTIGRSVGASAKVPYSQPCFDNNMYSFDVGNHLRIKIFEFEATSSEGSYRDIWSTEPSKWPCCVEARDGRRGNRLFEAQN